MNIAELTRPSALLDFETASIRKLILDRGWSQLSIYERIGAVYAFVRDEIKFGYNRSDDISASEVLSDGYGQCNTKAILLMALIRAVGVPTQFHGFTIDKSLQRGVVPELIYPITPQNIVHSWVEVYFEGKWVNLEGFILDNDYLAQLRQSFPADVNFCGYGVGTENLQNPQVDWQGGDTYVQSTAINQDLGIYETPDAFFKDHAQNLSWVKKLLYAYFVRHWMNARVQKLRCGKKVPALAPGDFTAISLDTINLKHELQ